MEYQKVQPEKGYEIVMRQILEQIHEGKLEPGQKLPSVVDLAASLGVGRSMIREALSALKAMGWLYIRQGGGTYVNMELPNPQGSLNQLFNNTDSLREILEVRKILETGAIALAAQNRNPEDLQKIEQILSRMEDVLQDESAGERADVEFHMQIAEASHNALLIQLMKSLSLRMQETMRDMRRLWFYKEETSAIRLLAEHQAIYEAIRLQDGDAAAKLMEKHLLKVEKVLKKESI
jgi:GntR family transcriptional repressor for pyruvate dehydrogenase complex